jgi:hypothetical protein
MSIIHSSYYNDYIQTFSIKKENKINHGEVHTPYAIIKSMVELFPPGYFSDPTLTILDPGTGQGTQERVMVIIVYFYFIYSITRLPIISQIRKNAINIF